jgi:hypothetical protein
MSNGVNPFPPHRRGLWRVRAVPYLFKDRWRARKAKMRALPSAPARQEAGS